MGAAFLASALSVGAEPIVCDVAGASTAPGTAVIGWPRKASGTENQLWQLEASPEAPGWFYIVSALTGAEGEPLVMDVEGGSSAPATPIISYPRKLGEGAANQLWMPLFEPLRWGFAFMSRLNGFVLDLREALTTPGTPVVAYPPHLSIAPENQLWTPLPA